MFFSRRMAPSMPALVGVIGVHHSRFAQGRADFRAQQRPGAGADIGKIRIGHGNGGHGTGRVVRSGGDDGDFRHAALPGNLRKQCAAHRAGGLYGRKDAPRQAKAVDQFEIPVAREGVDQLRGGGKVYSVPILPVSR